MPIISLNILTISLCVENDNLSNTAGIFQISTIIEYY